jgi:hypothetical protein
MASKSTTLTIALRTMAIWAISWGLCGTVLGVIATTIEPDTGHIPRYEVPLLFGIPLSLGGIVGGLMFGLISGLCRDKMRLVLGGTIGGIAGIVPALVSRSRSVALVLFIAIGVAMGVLLGSKWFDRTPIT